MKLLIIGAGPGGYETALAAAKRGVEVVLVEAGPVGGTCLNEGCIPTKSFCKNAQLLEQLREAEAFGVSDLAYNFDFKAVAARKNAVVEQLRSGVESLLSHKLITLVRGKASFKDPHTVTVGDEEYSADYIIIATGSVSASLPVPGADLEGILTSKEILDIEELPKKLCVIGGGVIGLEFASIFNSFSCEVTVLEYCKEILPRFDTDLAKRLKQCLGKKGIDINTQSQVLSISKEGDQYKVTFLRKGKEESVVADKVLMAVGRKANVDSLNLSEAGVEFGPKGVVVNEFMQTNQIDLTVMPAAVFTSPEAASVGLTEDECKEKEIPVKCLKSFFRANGKAVTMGETEGFCKVIVEEETGLLLGCHLFGPHSSDIVQEVCALISRKSTLKQLQDIIHTHPTLTEVIQSVAHQ